MGPLLERCPTVSVTIFGIVFECRFHGSFVRYDKDFRCCFCFWGAARSALCDVCCSGSFMKPPLSGVNKGNGRKWKCSYREDERTGRYTHGSEGTPDTFLFVKVEVLYHDLCSVSGLSFQQRRGKRRWLALAMYELTLAFERKGAVSGSAQHQLFFMYQQKINPASQWMKTGSSPIGRADWDHMDQGNGNGS
jgi:hypothetical protein